MTLTLEQPGFMEGRRYYEIVLDNMVESPLQQSQYLVADLDANADLSATVVFSPAANVFLKDIKITSDGSVAGVDDSNTAAVTAASALGTIVTKTYNSTVVFPADNVQESLGTLLFPYVVAGGRIDFTITQGTTANIPPCILTISYQDADAYPAPGWGILASNAGTAVIADGVKGILALSPGAADNDEIYLFSKYEAFKFADQKPFTGEWLVQYAESTTDDANIMAGVMDAVAADSLQDDGAGPKASYSGAVFFKVDGGTVWVCETSIAGAQVTTTTAVTAGGSAGQVLRIEYHPTLPTTGDVQFFIDNVLVAKHEVTHASATEMQIVAAAKNGGAHAETLSIENIGCRQLV